MGDSADTSRTPGKVAGRTRWGLFGAGLAAYVAGFVLLGRDHPDLAPAVIIGGILTMLWALLV